MRADDLKFYNCAREELIIFMTFILIIRYSVISFSKERMQKRELNGQHISSASTFLVGKCFIIV